MAKFHFYKHQDKERALVNALIAADWEETTAINADVVFADTDYGSMRKQLEALHRQGKKIMIYPHAGRLSLFNDLPDGAALEGVAVQFVTAYWHKEILARIGYPRPVEVIGWYLCPLREFRPRTQITNVLFAPIHPDADGTLYPTEKAINAAAFAKLLPLVRDKTINLTVRHINTLKKNGLPAADPEVTYIQGKPDQTYADIDRADVVVSAQTFAYLALARGVPLVGMGENIAPHLGDKVVQSWERYKDLFMYPLDILQWDNPELVLRLGLVSYMPRHWQERMVGLPFDAKKFVETVERYL